MRSADKLVELANYNAIKLQSNYHANVNRKSMDYYNSIYYFKGQLLYILASLLNAKTQKPRKQ